MEEKDPGKIKQEIAKSALHLMEEEFSGLPKVIGLGSGTTVKYFIELLAEKGLDACEIVSSSNDTTILCNTLGIKVIDILSTPTYLDLYVDGADSVFSNQKACIKGKGGAMLREKVLAYGAKRFYVLVENEKLEKQFQIPIEVVPFALNFVFEDLKEKGYNPTLRMAKEKLGPTITDNNNFIIDINPKEELFSKLAELHEDLIRIPGVVDTGIFVREMTVITIVDEKPKVINF